MTHTKERKQKRVLQAVLLMAAVAVGAFTFAMPMMTDDASDADDVPSFTKSWRWGGTELGTSDYQVLHVVPCSGIINGQPNRT